MRPIRADSSTILFPHVCYHPKVEPRLFNTREEFEAADNEDPGWQDNPAKCRSMTKKLADKYLRGAKRYTPKYDRKKLERINDYDDLLRLAVRRKLITKKQGKGRSRAEIIDMILDYQEEQRKAFEEANKA